jgi:hypothetical protein
MLLEIHNSRIEIVATIVSNVEVEQFNHCENSTGQ